MIKTPETFARRILPFLIVMAVCISALGPSVFSGKIPGQTDWIETFGPWGEHPWLPETNPPHNRGGGDNFFVYIPDRLAAIQQWQHGRIPLWNQYISGGVPFLGMQTANPLDPLLALELLIPGGRGMGLGYVLLLAVAGVGVILFLRDRGLHEPWALAIAGIAFSLNPYFTVWLENRVFVAGLATLLLSFWAMERVLVRSSARREMAILMLSIGYAALGGTLQTFALFLLMLIVRLGVLFITTPGLSSARGAQPKFLLLSCSLLGGLMIGILPLVSGVEMLTQSTRLGPGGYYADSNFLPLRSIALWFNPEIFSPSKGGEFTALEVFHRRFMSGSGFGYMGVVVLGLAVLAFVRRSGPYRERLFWGGLSVLTLGFLFLQATPFHSVFVRVFPWLTDVDLLRGLIVVNLGGALLAGWGAAEMGRLLRSRAKNRRWIFPWIGVLSFGGAAIVISRTGLPTPHALWRDLMPIFVVGAVVIGMAWIPFHSLPKRMDPMFLVAGLCALELLRFHFVTNSFASPASLFPPHEAVQKLKPLLSGPAHPRYLVEAGLRIFPPNTGSVYGMPDVRGYSNVPIARYRTLLECAEGRTDLKNLPILSNLDSPIYSLLGAEYVFAIEPFDDPRYERIWQRLLHRRRDCLPRAFMVHEVSPVMGRDEMRQQLSDPGFDPGRRVYLETECQPFPNVSPSSGEEGLHIRSMESDRVVIDATNTGFGILVLSDAYYPGWRAEVDGKASRILPADWGLRGVGVPIGAHQIVFRYRPMWLVPGIWMSILGLFLALSLFLDVRALRNRLHREKTP